MTRWVKRLFLTFALRVPPYGWSWKDAREFAREIYP